MSSPNPIASDLDKEYRGSEREKFDTLSSDSRYSENLDAPRSISDVNSRDGNRISGIEFLPDMLDAQQRLISAQHQFLHDNNMQALARAQLDVIAVQNRVLNEIGVFG